MCGITGAIWNRPDGAITPAQIQGMADAIRHRGPDDEGFYNAPFHRDAAGDVPGVGLGFRRLSIIDLEGARQPLCNEDQSMWMVFNGEIYNYPTLRRRLEGAGHQFRTDGDGENILHLYEDVGLDCFSHLNGMFAIAIWDANRRRLVLGRDRLGQKPLYYTIQDGRLLFASELKSFATIPGVLETIDPAAIDEFLTYQYIPHPNTIWKGVFKLPPGHWAIYQDGQLTVKRYWDIAFDQEEKISEPEAIEQLRELLTDSVRLRLQADVPVGAFLSGGIDSSLMVALAQKQRTDPIRTFSIGFPNKDFDETAYAQQVADYVHTKHTRFEVQPDGVSIIDKLVWHYDEPFGDSSAIPTWYLSELTRGEVTVALSGDGGDELFGGYERYRALWLSRKLQQVFPVHKLPGLGLIQKLPDSSRRRSIVRRGKRFLEALGQPAPRRYLNWLQIFPESMRAEMYADGFVSQLPGEDPFEFLHDAWKRSDGRDLVTQASMADLQTYLPCDLMTKVDIASMAHGLEVRQPMLDYRVVELAARLPVAMKFRGRRGKLLLRSTFEKEIPASIWTRPKMGFGVPISDWFRNELKPMVHDLLLDPNAKLNQYMRPEAIASMVQLHVSGQQNHSYRLWNLLVLEKWLRRWTGGSQPVQ
ncbi:Asparagine synthetase [glutamine-hydrolyzing] 1 [Roseimaritima multifibrata]|uniref:asparagine synthase (glutamine-hydrolyzing) n=1 Tax=Roseimaritima multifibrata TaxID=1930274 RepID=A0A517M8V3_9BACT|nr:asparagine synthase (glutamine-hydrolyzing) [Roseimaritima multifibrata]QDS91313.1 Asparagine synthetase [glutamine-hydrolyzing] 1 [Roseimaritima multifibrata]